MDLLITSTYKIQCFVAAPLLWRIVWSEPQNCVWEYCSRRARNSGTEMSLLAGARCCLFIVMVRVCGNSLEVILTFILSQAAVIISTKHLCLRRVWIKTCFGWHWSWWSSQPPAQACGALVGLVWQRRGRGRNPFSSRLFGSFTYLRSHSGVLHPSILLSQWFCF